MIASTNVLLESFQHISGFLFVVFVLTTLWVIIAVLGKLFVCIEQKQQTSAAPKATTPASVVKSDPNAIPEEDLVIIASTVAMMFGQNTRLVSIQNTGRGWSQEGRRQHVMSHKIN